jgi:hypothetical protein
VLTHPPGLGLDSPSPDIAAEMFLLRFTGNTAEAYRTDLRHWGRWLDELGISPFDADRNTIQLWVKGMQGRAPATVARRLACLSSFYRYLEDEGLVERVRWRVSAGLGVRAGPFRDSTSTSSEPSKGGGAGGGPWSTPLTPLRSQRPEDRRGTRSGPWGHRQRAGVPHRGCQAEGERAATGASGGCDVAGGQSDA